MWTELRLVLPGTELRLVLLGTELRLVLVGSRSRLGVVSLHPGHRVIRLGWCVFEYRRCGGTYSGVHCGPEPTWIVVYRLISGSSFSLCTVLMLRALTLPLFSFGSFLGPFAFSLQLFADYSG